MTLADSPVMPQVVGLRREREVLTVALRLAWQPDAVCRVLHQPSVSDGEGQHQREHSVRFASGLRKMPAAALLESLADVLLERDDIDAVTCLA